MVALLLFCVAPNKCAEEIVVIQTPSRNGDLLHALKHQDFTRIGIQFEITLYTPSHCTPLSLYVSYRCAIMVNPPCFHVSLKI